MGNDTVVTPGKWFCFEGGDSVGKTGVIDHLCSLYNQDLYVRTREPGGTPTGEEIRNFVFEHKDRMSSFEQGLMMYTSRAMHIDNLIRPTLLAGKHVFCDRGDLSTFAYQGGDGNFERFLNMSPYIHGKKWLGDKWSKPLYPDLAIFISVPPEVQLERQIRRGRLNNFDSHSLAEITERHQRYCMAISVVAQAGWYRVVVVNGQQPELSMRDEIAGIIGKELGVATVLKKGNTQNV